MFCHAFSGCGTTSSLSGKDKKSFFRHVDINEWDYSIISKIVFYCNTERKQWWWIQSILKFFVIRLYSKTPNIEEMNKTRRILFSRDNKVIENIPPTKGALRQHVLWSVLQSSKWRQSLWKEFNGRDACQWGW